MITLLRTNLDWGEGLEREHYPLVDTMNRLRRFVNESYDIETSAFIMLDSMRFVMKVAIWAGACITVRRVLRELYD